MISIVFVSPEVAPYIPDTFAREAFGCMARMSDDWERIVCRPIVYHDEAPPSYGGPVWEFHYRNWPGPISLIMSFEHMYEAAYQDPHLSEVLQMASRRYSSSALVTEW